MTTIQDRIIKDYGIKYQEVIGDLVDSAIDVGSKTSNNPLEIDLNPVKKLMPEFVQARTKIEQFLIQSIKEVEEETRKEVVEECKQKMAQSNEWWNKKLLSITNKEKQK